MTYAKIIKELAPPGQDARHIEAIIRLRNATLEGLSRSEFRKEVLVAVACTARIGSAKTEELARSLGLNSHDNETASHNNSEGGGGSLSLPTKEAEYRGFAAYCLDLAKNSCSDSEKARLLATAEAWHELAEHENRHSQPVADQQGEFGY